jgi:hypothetical protein
LFDLKSGDAFLNNTILTFLFLLNTKETRIHLKREKELARILSMFTDSDLEIKESELDSLTALGKRVIIMMSRS